MKFSPILPQPFRAISAGIMILVLILLDRNVGNAQTIQVQTIPAPVSTLPINAIDFLNATTPQWLFTINLTTNPSASVEVKMSVRVNVNLTGGEPIENPAVELLTRPFTIPGMLTITNLDIGSGRLVQTETYEVKPSAKRVFEQIALPSGSMPAGTYTFEVSVTPTTPGIQPGNGSFTIVLSNPSTPLLVFPTENDQFANQYPFFQWQYDGAQSSFSIFEKLPGQSTLEETAGGVPHYTEVLLSTSFQYPTTGARPLQPGKTYVWFVAGLSGTSGGTNVNLRSALRAFTVASGGLASYSQVIEELERALPPRFRPLFDRIREEGLAPFGGLRLNGTSITSAELLSLLNDLRNNPDKIVSVELE